MLALDQDVAGRRDLAFEHRVLFQPPHQHAGPPVDETGGQPLMQRVRQTILYRARALLPMGRVAQPLRAVGGEGPGADVGDAVGEGIDVAVGVVGVGDLAGEPVVGNDAVAGQEAEQGGDQLGVVGRRDLAVVGDLADVPERGDALATVGERRRPPRRGRRDRGRRRPPTAAPWSGPPASAPGRGSP